MSWWIIGTKHLGEGRMKLDEGERATIFQTKTTEYPNNPEKRRVKDYFVAGVEDKDGKHIATLHAAKFDPSTAGTFTAAIQALRENLGYEAASNYRLIKG